MKRVYPQPKGANLGNGKTKIAVVMKTETFQTICEMARKENKKFSDMCELLLETGLTDIQESDKLELSA